MNARFCMTMLVAALAIGPAAYLHAQTTNNPNNAAGSGNVATPRAGDTNPALTTGTMPRDTVGVPNDKNPNVGGATGQTVVPGSKSTINSDREGSTQQKTGTTR